MGTSEPVEITTLETLRERIKTGGVIAITRGTFEVPIAHMPDCPSLQQIRIPTERTGGTWLDADYATALTTLGARKCRQCW